MWILLPAISFAALLLALTVRLGAGDMLKCWRESFLSAAVVCGLFVVASSELLSILRALTHGWLVAAWSLAGIVAVSYCVCQLLKTRPRFDVERADWPVHWTLPILGVVIVVLAVGLIALVAPPNTWDSMTYHMSRVAHWTQNRTISLYPTHIVRQLCSGPGAELAVLHLSVLSGTDRFANLVQWFSMVGSIIGVSLIAKQLGADSKGQILAAAATATIPMGILQGSSTQTDYAVSFWLVCFVSSTLSMATTDRKGWTQRLKVGGSLGLALLVKATAYIFAAPFVIWLGVRQLRSRPGRGLTSLGIIAAIAIAANLGFYVRNMELSGSPLGLGHAPSPTLLSPPSTVNSVWTGLSLVSNMARNLAQHIGTPFAGVNAVTAKAICCLHRFLGIGVNDPRTTFHSSAFRTGDSFHEDWAGNPLHVLLIAWVILLLLATPQLRLRRVLLVYAAALVSQFLIYSLLLKWQPWGSRLQLPMFVLWAPLIGIVMLHALGRKMGFPIACLLLLLAAPYVLWNSVRPLTAWTAGDVIRGRQVPSLRDIWHDERIAQYFSNRRELLDSYAGAAGFVKSTHCRSVGLYMGENDYEYPLWVLLRAGNSRTLRIEHVDVNAAWGGTAYPLGQFQPGVIIRTDSVFGSELTVGRDVYTQQWSAGPLSVLVKETDADSATNQ